MECPETSLPEDTGATSCPFFPRRHFILVRLRNPVGPVRTLLRTVLILTLGLFTGLPQLAPGVHALACPQVSAFQFWRDWIASSMEFSGDGSYLAFGSLYSSYGVSSNGTYAEHYNSTLTYFRRESGVPFWKASLGLGLRSPFPISMASNGSRIVAGYPTGGVQVFNAQTGTPIWSFVVHPHTSENGTSYIHRAISGDGRYVAMLVMSWFENSNTLYLFNGDDGRIVWRYNFAPSIGNSTAGNPLALSDDGTRIAAIVGDSLFMFSNQDNRTLWSVKPLMDGFPQIGYSPPDGEDALSPRPNLLIDREGTFVVALGRQEIRVFSGTDGMLTTSIDLDETHEFPYADYEMSFSRDGSTISVDEGHKTTIRDRASGSELFAVSDSSLSVDIRGVSGVSLSGDGKIVGMGTGSSGLIVFDRAGRRICDALVGPRNYLDATRVRVSEDGRYIAASTSHDTTIIRIPSGIELLVPVLTNVVFWALIVAGVGSTLVLGLRGLLRKRKARAGVDASRELGIMRV